MIYLNYKEFKIGKLEFVNEHFIYNSLQEESLALEKYVGLVDYDLTKSENKSSKILFSFFVRHFLSEIKDRLDILKKIEINDENCYEILKKLCKLNLDKFNFWLSEN